MVRGFGPTGSPEAIFGFPSEKLQEAANAVRGMSPISPRISQDGRILGGLVGLFPLLEKLRAGEKIGRGDLHAHRSDIEDVVHPLVDEFMPASVFLRPLGALGKVTLDFVVEKEFEHIVPFAMKQAKGYIPRAEPYIYTIAAFTNPRHQFVNEVNTANRMVTAAIDESGEETDAFTAGRSLQDIIFRKLLHDPQSLASDLPAFSRLVAIRNSRANAGKDVDLVELAALAPGIMQMLGSLAPEEEQRPDIIEALKQNPLPGDSHSFDAQELSAFEQAAPVILPMARDLIPESGDGLRQALEEVKVFLA